MRAGFLVLGMLTALAGGGTGVWVSIAPGLDLGRFPAGDPARAEEARVVVLRIDPRRWDLECHGVIETGDSRGRTARRWSEAFGLAAAINAGMFASDFRTHLGYQRDRGEVRSAHVNPYQSIAAFDPVEGRSLPRFRLFDLDDPAVTLAGILKDYASVIQNLRLIKRPGANRWPESERSWSEAALGEDAEGRALFIFSRPPFSMHDLDRLLLSLPIGLVAAQHLEGGPEAQLYLRVGATEIESVGSDNGNATAWPIPNVLGIRPRVPSR